MSDQPDFRALFEAGPTPFLVLRPDDRFTIIAVSDSYLAATLATREGLLGRGFFEAFPDNPEDSGATGVRNLRASLGKVLSTRAADRMPIQRYDIPGPGGGFEGRHWSPINSPVLSPGGEVAPILHHVEDVTEVVRLRREGLERKTVEAALRESGAWFSTTLNSIGDAVIATDSAGRVVFMNAVAERLTGWTIAQAGGRPSEDVFVILDEETRAPVPNPVDLVLATGKPHGLAGRTVLASKDGAERVIEDSAAPIKGDDGRIGGVVLVFHDASEKRRAQQALNLSEERLRALATASSDVMYVMTSDWSEMLPLDGRALVASNDAPSSDWMQKNLPPSEHDLIREEIRGAVSEKRMFALEHRLYRSDGSVAWTYSRAVPMFDANGEIIEGFGMASDLTRRKEAEEERGRLEAEAERQRRIYEAALSNTPDFVDVFGLDHRDLYANEALDQMWGRPREDVLGRHWLDLGCEPCHAEMHDREIDQVVATRRPILGEVPFTGTHGRRVYESIFVPVIAEDGAVVAVAGTTRDVTERQRSEQAIRDQDERLRENDRRKDELLAMLAHELRNPLWAIGNAVTLTAKGGLQEHFEWAMEVITRQRMHLTRLIDDLLDVSRINRRKIELRQDVVALTTILDGAIATARPFIEERRHTLEIAVDGGDLWANVDPTRLEQVVVNLLSNAAKHSETGGHIRLSARDEGDDVVVSVRDRGLGIPPETLPQMFDLFALGDCSLARSEGGLGIGLTVVKKLTEMHGGTVEAVSESPDKGSEFMIRLSKVARPAASEPKETPPVEGARKTSRIHIVEDNVDTARGMARLLKPLGHEVAVAHDGPEGLEKAKEHHPRFVLLDIGLPGMDGYEVAARLRREECGKEAVIIAISGYGQDEDRRRSKEAGFDHHLLKPLDQDTLFSLLSAEMNSTA